MLVRRRTVASLLITCASLFATTRAQANGRFPSAQYFLAGKGPIEGTMLLRATFGVAVSDDDGASFHYICEDALGFGTAAFDPPVALLADRSILVGLYNGARTIAPDRCAFAPVPSLDAQFLTDFDVDPTGKIVVASTSTGFIDDFNYVWRSEDGAATFTKLGPGVKGTGFQSIEIARTDPKRIWASALQLSPRKVIVYRSDDGGATLLESTSFPFPDSDFAVVSAVDPKNADVVYVRVEITEPTARRTSLLRTGDAGATWREVVRSKGEMLGFALGDDGKTLWFGGVKDGLQRSDDGGATWTTLSSTHVQCLRWSENVLYVCGAEGTDIDAGIAGDRFALADSCDHGTTLHPLLGFAEIQGPVVGCDPTSPESAKCPDRWDGEAGVKWTFPTDDLPLEPLCSTAGDGGPPDVDAAIDTRSSDALPDAMEASTDATTDDAHDAAVSTGDASSGGCGCVLVGGASDATWIALAIASMLAAVGASRRSHR